MRALKTIHYGWYIAAACLAVSCIRAGVGFQTMGFIINPAREELGWSNTQITGAISFRELLAGLTAPFVGRWIDMHGPRLVMAAGAILVGLSLSLSALTSQFWQFVVVFGVIGGIGVAGLSNALVFPLIAKWFAAQRGRATGIVSSGANLGGAILSPLIVWLLSVADWRTAWFVLGLLPVLVLVPLALFVLRRQPEDMGLEPYGADEADTDGASAKGAAPADMDLKAALRTRAFWFLMIGWNLIDFALKGALLHKIPAAQFRGFSTAEAAGLVATYGVCAVLGKIGTGFLADRVPSRVLVLTLAVMQAAGLFLFINANGLLTLHLGYGLLSGLSGGGLIMMMPFLLATLFGRRNQGAIMGAVTPLVLVAGIGGPMMAALLFDATGSYDRAFSIYAIMALVGGFALLGVRPPHAAPARSGDQPGEAR